MDREIFVQKVKLLCHAKGITPAIACRESGAGESLIYNINRGRTPAVDRLQLLAAYLGVTTSELLGENVSGPTTVSDDAVIKVKGRHTLSADAVEVAFAYDDASPEIRAAVRRVLAIEDRSFPAKSTHPGEAM